MSKTARIAGVFAAFVMVWPVVADAFELGDLIHKEELGDIGKALSKKAQDAGDAPASGNALAGFSSKEQIGSLKQALTQGAETAVASLAKENGYLGNEKVRIPLPDHLQKVADLMRAVGMGKYADDLDVSINRAAEAAVPEAKTLLIGAVRGMSVSDAKGILTGGDDAATQYFRRKTEGALTERFKPIVAKSMRKVELAQTYDQFAAKGAQWGLVDERDASLDSYITRKALDGLFLMMAEQEKAIRANPLEATGTLARKVFSALKR